MQSIYIDTNKTRKDMIFVTGGTGMVGAHLLYKLVKEGKSVRALKRSSSSLKQVETIFEFYSPENSQHLFNQIEWIDGDILNINSMRECLEGISIVYHSAAIISFDKNDAEEVIENNREGTANLVDACVEQGIKRFCFVSSVATMGSVPKGEYINEKTEWDGGKNKGYYAQSKFQSEMEINRAHQQGLDFVMVNPSVIIGPGDWKSGSPKFFNSGKKGMIFYTQGGTGFVDVRDVVNSMFLLIESEEWDKIKNKRYLLNGENLSFRKLYIYLNHTFDNKKPFIYAGSLILNIVWIFSSLFSPLSKKQQIFTKEFINNAQKTQLYDGNLICKTVGLRYRPIEESVKYFYKYFKQVYKF